MEKIYSKSYPGMLLHIIVRKSDFKEGRQDIVDPNQFIQCSMLQMNKGKTFQPHYHIWKSGPENVIAQESWVVISGRVKCIFYDINNSLLGEWILEQGDASFTLRGGHNYEVMEEGTLVYEYKTGPYEGQELDKKFVK